MSILTVFVVVNAGHNYWTTGTAAGSGGKSIQENRSVTGHFVDFGSYRHFVAVAAKGRAFIIGNEKNDISFCSKWAEADKHKYTEEFHFQILLLNTYEVTEYMLIQL